MKQYVRLIKATSVGHFLSVDKIYEVLEYKEGYHSYVLGGVPNIYKKYMWDKNRFEIVGCPCGIDKCIAKHKK